MFELFTKGGPVMAIIFGLSIYVLGVILFKSYQFWKLRVLDSSVIDHSFAYLSQRGMKDAITFARSRNTPLARIMAFALACVSDPSLSKEKAEEEISYVASAELRALETHLRGLEMSASVAPLLGLLGTVIGIILTFSTLASTTSRVDPSLLAGGIWTALLTTAAGLSVAIPALAAHYIFDGIVERSRALMQDAGNRVLSLYGKVTPVTAQGSGSHGSGIQAQPLEVVQVTM